MDDEKEEEEEEKGVTEREMKEDRRKGGIGRE